MRIQILSLSQFNLIKVQDLFFSSSSSSQAIIIPLTLFVQVLPFCKPLLCSRDPIISNDFAKEKTERSKNGYSCKHVCEKIPIKILSSKTYVYKCVHYQYLLFIVMMISLTSSDFFLV